MTSEPTDPKSFAVDLRGIVDLLGRHIYSAPRVFLRELLQNGADAIEARRRAHPEEFRGGHVRVHAPSEPGGEIVVIDNGIGLTASEAADLLSTVGHSSKRDPMFNLRTEGYLGQFGIGLLSCFMIADDIVVRSRSARTGEAIEWVGSSEGTFDIRTLSAEESHDIEIGTQVRLRPRPDESGFASSAQLTKLARTYGEYLPLSIDVVDESGRARSISRPAVFADPHTTDVAAVRELGIELLDAEPLAAITLAVPGTSTVGIAYVLPYAPPPGSSPAHRAYLGRMLLNERLDTILPTWAFFVRCVFTTDGLTPTASREQFVEDDALEQTRKELGATLRRWILAEASTNPVAFERFTTIHGLALRSMSVHDDDIASAVLPSLVFETSNGPMTLAQHFRNGTEIRFTETVDEFRQVSTLSSGDTIVNGGYTYDAELLRRIPDLFTGSRVRQVTVDELIDDLAATPLADREVTAALEARATKVLTQTGCRVVTRLIQPDDLAAVHVADPAAIRRLERGSAREAAPALWSSILAGVDDIIDKRADNNDDTSSTARLCLNWSSPLVRRLAVLSDDIVFARSIEILYVQAMLIGRRPLGHAARDMLTTAISDLVELSVGLHEDTHDG